MVTTGHYMCPLIFMAVVSTDKNPNKLELELEKKLQSIITRGQESATSDKAQNTVFPSLIFSLFRLMPRP